MKYILCYAAYVRENYDGSYQAIVNEYDEFVKAMKQYTIACLQYKSVTLFTEGGDIIRQFAENGKAIFIK